MFLFVLCAGEVVWVAGKNLQYCQLRGTEWWGEVEDQSVVGGPVQLMLGE